MYHGHICRHRRSRKDGCKSQRMSHTFSKGSTNLAGSVRRDIVGRRAPKVARPTLEGVMRNADAGIQHVAVDALPGAVDIVVVSVIVDRSRKFGAGGNHLESVPSIQHRVLGVRTA